MKTNQFIRHLRMTLAVTLCCALPFIIASCSNDDCDGQQTLGVLPEVITLDGSTNNIVLAKGEQCDWKITECPEWITPVAIRGTAADTIRLYVESNSHTPLRQGNITVDYANGNTYTTRAQQDNSKASNDLRRSYATGWGFDIRTYNDSRGLRDQIFNIQRLNNFNPNIYRRETSKSTHFEFYYGDDASDLQNNMKGKLSVEGKFKVFSLDLQASFGANAINNSKRIFSWIRDYTSECIVLFNNLDYSEVQDCDTLFTTDFRAMRKQVIEAGASDAAISRLINNYGTHFVERASLGGCYDYYYSSVYDNSSNTIDVEATLKFAYNKKFNFNASADYSNDLKEMNQETIEKFSIKGGNNVDITNKVFAGTIKQADTDAWKKSLADGKWELISFSLKPISWLFPDDIAEKIDIYLDRLYYSEIPVTRVIEK